MSPEHQPLSSLAIAVGKIPSGLAIATASGNKDRTAMLASWFQQVSFSPLLISVCIKKERPMESLIEESGFFGLNILSEGDFASLKRYAKGFEPGIDPWMEDAKATLEPNQPAPLFSKGYAWLLLVFKQKVDVGGDHLIYIGEVVEGKFMGSEEQKPYVHIRKDGLGY